ncbi:hypothetical protein ACGFNV_29665 [Streptomyces sp. NPDC048751]|uniref:hypothetical protein n=1 Tax=Streptomyces sp. NPDC048751 TaxID=3365591 RepID=UPI003723324C
MLALRLTRRSHPAVQLRRLLVAAASAGTGFLLLCTLGYAMSHPDDPDGSVLRLAWCLVPLAATVHFALAVARTDPGTRPRPGLAAIGLGPARLMAVAATTTVLSCTLGSMLALLVFLHLRGDLTGMPFDGAAAQFLAADSPLPLPAALTLLSLLPTTASLTVALSLRPRHPDTPTPRPTPGRLGTRNRTPGRDSFGTYARFGAHLPVRPRVSPTQDTASEPYGHPADPHMAADGILDHAEPSRLPAASRAGGAARSGADGTRQAPGSVPHPPATADDGTPAASGPSRLLSGHRAATDAAHAPSRRPASGRTAEAAPTSSRRRAGSRAAGAAPVPPKDGTPTAPGSATHPPAATDNAPQPPGNVTHPSTPADDIPPAPGPTPTGLPWGIATLAAGLAVEAYGNHTGATTHLTLPGGLPPGPLSVLIGWTLTALGLALAGPGLTHLCGRLLQTARPGALRLLAGRVLMAEATRIGRPLGVVCAVASGTYTMAALSTPGDPAFGPLTTLGTLLVTGCTVATLLTAAVEARQARADTTAALLRLGAPATMLRSAAALRAGSLLALFAPLTLLVAELSALPLTS